MSKKHTVKAKSKELGIAPSLTAAAARLKLPPALLRHCKSQLGWDCFDSGNRVNLDRFIELLAEHPEIAEQFGQAINAELEAALLTRERRLALADKRARENRVHIHEDEVKRDCGRYVTFMKTRLLAMENNLAVAMRVECGLNEDQEQKLKAAVARESREVLQSLQQGAWFKDSK